MAGPSRDEETPLRVLTFSTLYPSETRPRHGIFVETRLRHMVALGGVDVRVVAPVPWFPSAAKRFGEYARLASTPRHGIRYGIDVVYPRYFMLPKIGMALQPYGLALAGLQAARRLRHQGFAFDVIDAHYFYPDGVAAALMAARLRKPFIVTARGSDLNFIANLPLARARIVDAANRSARIICVSAALKNRAIDLGVDANRIEVLRNGVDTSLFVPLDRDRCRGLLGLERLARPLLIAVGNLVPEKGIEQAVRALAHLHHGSLLIVGEGPEQTALERLAAELGVTSRVAIVAAMPQPRLALAYNAADMLLLPSLREGWPNVLLEAMSCGTPVIAADTGGVREIVSEPDTGRVLPDRSVEALVVAIEGLVRNAPDREALRRHARSFGWRVVVERYREVLRGAAMRSACYVDSGTTCATC